MFTLLGSGGNKAFLVLLSSLAGDLPLILHIIHHRDLDFGSFTLTLQAQNSRE